MGSNFIEINFARGPPPPLRLCSRMCSRPCLRNPIGYERGEPIFWLPPMVSCCCLLLPVTPTAYPTVSKSRVREDVRVQVPPPAPRQSKGLATIGCQPFFIALVLMEGLERARGADEQEEERDAREPRHYVKRWRGTSHVSSRGTRPPSAPPQRSKPWLGCPTPE